MLSQCPGEIWCCKITKVSDLIGRALRADGRARCPPAKHLRFLWFFQVFSVFFVFFQVLLIFLFLFFLSFARFFLFFQVLPVFLFVFVCFLIFYSAFFCYELIVVYLSSKSHLTVQPVGVNGQARSPL